VTLRVHPCLVNGGRLIARGHILFNQAEARTGLTSALRQLRLAGVLVGDRPFSSHAGAVGESGGGQCRVPLEGGQALRAASLVAEREKLSGHGAECLVVAYLHVGRKHGGGIMPRKRGLRKERLRGQQPGGQRQVTEDTFA